MTELLKVGLELAFAEGSSKYKRLLERIPKNHTLEYDGKRVRTRELLQQTAIAGTNFIPAEVMNTVIEGQQLAVCFREVMPIYHTSSDSYAMPVGTGGGYAQKYAPGAEIKMNEEALSTRAVTIANYKEAVAVTREMIADAKIDAINREVMLAGRRIENALNQDMLTELLDNANQEHDTTGSNQGYKAMIGARKLLKKAGYVPNVVVVCPEAEAMLLGDLVPTANSGSVDAIVAAKLASLDMKLFSCAVADNSSTYAWEYNSDSDIGMLVLDSLSAGGIVIREDNFIDDFEDPLKDIVGAKVELRAGVKYAQSDASCRVEY